jgi:hypothetical protein
LGEERLHLVAGERPGDADPGEGLLAVAPEGLGRLADLVGVEAVAPVNGHDVLAAEEGYGQSPEHQPRGPVPEDSGHLSMGRGEAEGRRAVDVERMHGIL